ncbi:MAG: hypothetical protein US60_C0021G0015 [Microgenomates group bacterium GW2011_GWC1_37_8]|uniref:Uncharacterized protein n=1 Tax=Candidatus Woesebacteria bacterium GW2011_GWB1_38_8 TaxID=1618570 RepID=A0A0G0LD03_9BACT|nr:MAG: hypothetical protein US60_C0021G0015 [Microgenomates group bacterium GW2011_GWC1_37_8]KKQ85780.1 MAG: hypothetical protein UT08_C0004G0092 [Candidatus Woesebacteria bacterium GW2011_GWB1_38_8]
MVKQIIIKKAEAVSIEPTKKLAGVLSGSRVLDILEGLQDQTPLEVAKEVIEDGKKMVITTNWSTGESKRQFVVSVLLRKDQSLLSGIILSIITKD